MKVAMDVSHLNHEKLSGIGIYTIEMMRALGKLGETELTPVCRLSRLKYQRFFKMHVGGAKPWVRGIGEWGADIVHGPDFRVSPSWKAKRVVSIMDLAFLEEGMTSPEFARKKKRDLDSILDDHTPEKLLVISEATGKDLVKYRPKLADRIHVTLLGGDHMQVLKSPPDDEIRKQGKYFLFVGNLEARKNVLGIIKAFEVFCRTNKDTQLFLIGKPGYEGDKILQAVESSPARARIRILGYCSLADLQAYYRYAVALVYPSWIEGFGIPVVEAMQLGCPVITSSTTSTAEIAGETGWLIDPAENDALVQALFAARELLNEPDRRRSEIARAATRAESFTWERCARQTLEAYKQLT